jgi:hypothetical protein
VGCLYISSTITTLKMTEPTFWDRMRENVTRGIRTAADRTDELARLGKLKLDLVNLKRRLVYELGELGKQLQAHIDAAADKDKLGSVKEFVEQEEVKEILQKIHRHRVNIEDTERLIKQMSTSAESKSTPKEETNDESPKDGSGEEIPGKE